MQRTGYSRAGMPIFGGGAIVRSISSLHKIPADEKAPDLRGSCSYLIQLGIPQQPASGVVADVAVAAQQLGKGNSRAVGLSR